MARKTKVRKLIENSYCRNIRYVEHNVIGPAVNIDDLTLDQLNEQYDERFWSIKDRTLYLVKKDI